MKTTIALFSVLALTGALQANAEEASLDVSVDSKPVNVRVEMKERQEKPDAKAIRADIKKEIDLKKAEAKASIELKREASKESRLLATTTKDALRNRLDGTDLNAKDFRENAKKRMDSVVENAKERLSEALSKLLRAKDQIESRLLKFETAGATTTSARADLSIATAKLETARLAVSSVASTTVSTSTPQSIKTFKDTVKAAQIAIQDAHKGLMKVVSSMKGLQSEIRRSDAKNPPETATSTDQ